jgi:hypothetical protein
VGRTTNKSARIASQASAREKAAAARIAEKRAAQRRRATAVLSSVVVVALVVGGGVWYGLTRSSHPASNKVGAAAPGLVSQVTNVSHSVTDSVAAGSVAAASKPQTISGTPLGTATKPTLLYIGAEFCPFCAAQRWAMINSLSRFGTFTGLQTIRSSEDNLATFTFLKSHYASKYVTFDGKEQADQNHNNLQSLTKTEQAQWNKYIPPGASGPGYPFMDLAGKYVFTNFLVDPSLLTGKSWTQIAAAMAKPTSTLGKTEIGAANYITSTICREDGGKPATVCTAPIMSLTANATAFTG